MAVSQIEPWRVSLETFYRLVELGLFDEEKVELLDGVITPKMTKGGPHEALKMELGHQLFEAVGATHRLRIESPLTLAEGWDPEPDIAIVPPRWTPHPITGHPTIAPWVCEIADSSLLRDREIKRHAYARAGVSEFWLLVVQERKFEIFSRPEGDDYRDVRVATGGVVASSSVDDLRLDVDELWRAAKLPRSV